MQYDIYNHLPGLKGKVAPREMWVVIFSRWYQQQLQDNPNLKVVISDVRFFHELNCIKKLGGIIVKIIKPNREIELENHLSEIETQQIDDSFIDSKIINDKTIEDFHLKIENMVSVISKTIEGFHLNNENPD